MSEWHPSKVVARPRLDLPRMQLRHAVVDSKSVAFLDMHKNSSESWEIAF